MELLKMLLGLIVIITVFALIYGLGRLSIGKEYGENYDFVDVMLQGLVTLFLITVGLLMLFMSYLIGNEIISGTFK